MIVYFIGQSTPGVISRALCIDSLLPAEELNKFELTIGDVRLIAEEKPRPMIDYEPATCLVRWRNLSVSVIGGIVFSRGGVYSQAFKAPISINRSGGDRLILGATAIVARSEN